MGELSKLPNIGKAVEAQLIQVGIETPEALRQVGAKAAWLKIQEIDPSACIHRLMALEGAIQGVKKTMLPDAVKADLKAFYQEHKQQPTAFACCYYINTCVFIIIIKSPCKAVFMVN